MKCPYCTKEVHYHEYSSTPYLKDEDTEESVEVAIVICPACAELAILLRKGLWDGEGSSMDEVHGEQIVYPNSGIKPELPVEVPDIYRNEYREASIVFPLSPKASAALSRRCLQNFLQNELNIKKSNLSKEIEEYVQSKNLPSVISEAVDAIRNIGNFAAHPIKDTNTGEIVDVEPGEAEWLLEVLEALFDYHFVQPMRLQRKKDDLNKKLASLKKPLMK